MTARSTVFIVDDFVLLHEMITEYLEMEPDLAVCGTAQSGEEALATLPERGCDLALVDVAMPGMNGIEFVRRLGELRPGFPCLMLSGHAEEVYVREAMAAGARGYVTKGDPDAIVGAIRCVLGGEVYFGEQVRAGMTSERRRAGGADPEGGVL